MKVTPIKSDNLPRPRCSPQEREAYNRACQMEGVNVNQNMRTIALEWIAKIFKKHGGKK